MAAKILHGEFVHVVGAVDLKNGRGQILYVNPASTSVAAAEVAGHPAVELVVTGADGEELGRIHPVLRTPPPRPDAGDEALIQQDIPFVPGMRSVRLLVNGEEQDRFEAGAPAPEAVSVAGILPLDGLAGPGRRRHLDLTGLMPAHQPGVSYTVQVRPEGAAHWSTIAVGRPEPSLEVDRNQFPGTGRARVRVLRTTGFEEEVVADQEVDLAAGGPG